jgi:membrane-associated phospholipid phosphatase
MNAPKRQRKATPPMHWQAHIERMGRLLVRALPEELRLLKAHRWGLLLLFAGVPIPLWVFAALADEIHQAGALAFDQPLLEFAQDMAADGFDRVFLFASLIGYAWGVVPLSVALVLALAVLRHYRRAAFAAAALGGGALLNMATKQFFARARPDLWDSIAPEPTYSFPSAHAMGSMALAFTLVLLAWHGRWRLPAVAMLLLFVPTVGLSRIYLGVHYPSDILAGWAAASAWVGGCYLLVFGTPRARAWWRQRRNGTGAAPPAAPRHDG